MSSSMPDFASALGGPPGADPSMADPSMGDPSMGVDPSQLGGQDTGQGDQQFQTSLDALDAAEEALQAFIQIDPDEADRAVAANALQTVIKLKAANQQSAQTGGLKSLARALQQGPGGAPLGAPGA